MHLLSKQNIISLQNRKSFLLGLLFCSIVTFTALGQEERGSLRLDTSDGLEKTTDLKKPNILQVEKNIHEVKEDNSSSPKKEKEQLYKHRGEKEIKSESKSTLSFNLFLYVVDRFKEEDN